MGKRQEITCKLQFRYIHSDCTVIGSPALRPTQLLIERTESQTSHTKLTHYVSHTTKINPRYPIINDKNRPSIPVGYCRVCECRGVRCEGDPAGRQRENNPTVDVDGLYSVQMPNCEKKSRRTVESAYPGVVTRSKLRLHQLLVDNVNFK